MCRNGTMLEWTQSREKGFCKMKKKNMLFVCGTALVLALGSPQMTEVGFAKEKPVPIYNLFDVVGKKEYIVLESLYESPYRGGYLYGYRVFEPNRITVISQGNKKLIFFYFHFLDGPKLKDYGAFGVEVDLSNRTYRDFDETEWKSLDQEVNNCTEEEINDGCWNRELTPAVNSFVEYIKTNRPEIYNDVMESVRKAEEDAAAAERRKFETHMDSAVQRAENEVSLFAQYGKQIDWAEFTQDSVDYSKSPALSDLIGHVFQLTDTYGFQTQRGDNGTPVIKADRRKSALVHFTILQNSNGTYQIALMDDTGDFVGRDNVNRMPLMTDFRAYHEEFGYYTGLNDVFHKTGSFHSMGEVIGFPNLSNGLVSDGFVKVGLEKTDEVGKYRLVYYVTKESYDSYGGRSKASTKHDGYYATLTLVK